MALKKMIQSEEVETVCLDSGMSRMNYLICGAGISMVAQKKMEASQGRQNMFFSRTQESIRRTKLIERHRT